jgi:hypothetical protein
MHFISQKLFDLEIQKIRDNEEYLGWRSSTLNNNPE